MRFVIVFFLLMIEGTFSVSMVVVPPIGVAEMTTGNVGLDEGIAAERVHQMLVLSIGCKSDGICQLGLQHGHRLSIGTWQGCVIGGVAL